MKSQVLHTVCDMLHFWWCGRRNLKFITLGLQGCYIESPRAFSTLHQYRGLIASVDQLLDICLDSKHALLSVMVLFCFAFRWMRWGLGQMPYVLHMSRNSINLLSSAHVKYTAFDPGLTVVRWSFIRALAYWQRGSESLQADIYLGVPRSRERIQSQEIGIKFEASYLGYHRKPQRKGLQNKQSAFW